MTRDEALALIGQPVSAWTAANGEYVGTLLEVLPTRPWRAKVLVTGVLEVAQHFERGGACRRGFRPGETLEVGHSSVKPSKGPGTADYLVMLERAREQHQQWFDRDPAHRDAWIQQGYVTALTKAMAAETRRLAGEPWKLI